MGRLSRLNDYPVSYSAHAALSSRARYPAVMKLTGLPLLLALSSSLAARADTAAPAPVTSVAVRGDRIELPRPVYFEPGKAAVQPISQPLLDAVATAMRADAALLVVEIGVHSDERGADEYNQRLTQARAEAIAADLVAHGVAAARLRARGYGESRPLCREHNEACWSRNRRVELVITKRAPR